MTAAIDYERFFAERIAALKSHTDLAKTALQGRTDIAGKIIDAKTDTAITVSQHAAQFADAQTLSDLNAGNASIGGGSGGAGGTVVNFSGNNGGGLGGGTTSPN